MKQLFHVMYSCANSPEREKEEATYIQFVDYLDKCECKLNTSTVYMYVNLYLLNLCTII